MDLRIIADNVSYKFPAKLTLGELQVLAKDFNLTDPTELDPSNILHVSGLLFVAMRRENPTTAAGLVRRMLDSVTSLDVQDLDASEEPETPDPTQAADAATVAPVQA